MSYQELIKKYNTVKYTVGKHTATNNVFLDKVIGSLLQAATIPEPASPHLLEEAAQALIWSVWWREQLRVQLNQANREYLHLQRKVAHGCTDATCEQCDKEST